HPPTRRRRDHIEALRTSPGFDAHVATSFLSRGACSTCSSPRRARSSLVAARLELPLEDLARGVAGQLVEEDDLARHLVPGEVLLHPALEVVLAGRYAVLEGDVRLEPLAVVVVVHAHGGHLG